MTTSGRPHVWLDATHLPADAWEHHFPTVFAACVAQGIDPRFTPIPVAPAEHFLCGGVAVDRLGRTDVPGLFAVGEVAATGVHGANRLASNSLLEGLVFGRRLAARLVLDLAEPSTTSDIRVAGVVADPAVAGLARAVLGTHAGVVRDAAGLELAAKELATLEPTADPTWLVASAVVAAALLRQESRGAHFRADFPATSEWWRRRVTVRLDDGRPVATVAHDTIAVESAA